MLGCAEGGVTIEEIAKTKPEAIVKVAVTPDGSGLSTEIDSFLHQMNLKSDIVLLDIINKLTFQIFNAL